MTFSFSQSLKDTVLQNELNEVIVTATKTFRQLSNLPLPAKLISKNEIDKSSSSRLSDILDDQIGIFIVPDFGGANGIQIQGLDSQYTLILIDGYPLIGRQSGTLDLDRISIGNIDKIEIIKGSSSSLYGTDAIGGVINLITSKAIDSISFDISSKISSYSSKEYDLNFGRISKEAGVLNAYFNLNHSDGYDLIKSDLLKTVEPFKNYTGFLRYNFERENWSFFSSIRIFNEEQDFRYNEEDFGIIATTENNLNSSLNYGISDNLKFILDNYYTQYNSDENYLNSSSFEESYFKQSLFKSEFRSIINVDDKNKLTLGLGYNKEELDRNNFYKKSISQSSLNSFIQYEGFIFENTNYIFGARYDKHEQYKSEFSPSFSIRTQINDLINAKLSIGKGFKKPDFRQLYFNFSNSNSGYSVIGFNVANEVISNLRNLGQLANLIIPENELTGNLTPENSLSINLGFNFKPNNNLLIDLNLFKNQINNLIDYRLIATKINGQNIFSYYNLNKVITQGFEINSKIVLSNNFNFNIGYQFLLTRDVDAINDLKEGKIYARLSNNSSAFKINKDDYYGLYNRSKNNINLKLNYLFNDELSLYFKSRFRSKYGLTDSNGNNLLDDYDKFVESHIISDLSISQKFRKLNITLGVDNLFNYTDPENIPNYPGRIIYSKLSYKL
jgi:outer membrane receptor for ferrienterochelin and colicins